MFGRECLGGAQVGVARSFLVCSVVPDAGVTRAPRNPASLLGPAADSTDSGGAAGRTEGSSMPAAGGLVRPGQWERNLLKVSPPHPLFQRAFTAARTAMQAAPGPLVCGHGGLQSKRDYGGHGLALSFPRSAARWARSNREYTTVHPWKRHSQGSRRTPRIGARASCFSLSRSEFSFRLAACCNKPGARPATVGNGAFPA
jgi:hypothetical protein